MEFFNRHFLIDLMNLFLPARWEIKRESMRNETAIIIINEWKKHARAHTHNTSMNAFATNLVSFSTHSIIDLPRSRRIVTFPFIYFLIQVKHENVSKHTFTFCPRSKMRIMKNIWYSVSDILMNVRLNMKSPTMIWTCLAIQNFCRVLVLVPAYHFLSTILAQRDDCLMN